MTQELPESDKLTEQTDKLTAEGRRAFITQMFGGIRIIDYLCTVLRAYANLFIALLTALLLTACTMDGHREESAADPQRAIAFDTYIARNQNATRADAETESNMNDENLRKTGFGVFAAWQTDDTYNRLQPFNFMFNQKVEAQGTTGWTYAPVKYWPNDNQPADNEGAQGSKAHSYVHFFAYAPYKPYDASGDGLIDIATNGIINMPKNMVGDAYLMYKSSFDPDKDPDLLWAKQDYMYKTMPSGEGYVDGKVKFTFKHALARLGITVMGIFDHATATDSPSDGYSASRADSTRILLESVAIEPSAIPTGGRMYLAPKKSKTNNAYNSTDTPYWEPFGDGVKVSFNTATDNINTDLMFTANPAGADTAQAKASFLALPQGVTEVEQRLLNDKGSDHRYIMFPPTNNLNEWDEYQNRNNGSTGPLKVSVVYKVITYDPRLSLNTTKYFSIVTNDITDTFNEDIKFEPNKQYTLRLLLGLTSVKFEVLDVTDYEDPILITATVKEWERETPTDLDWTLDN